MRAVARLPYRQAASVIQQLAEITGMRSGRLRVSAHWPDSSTTAPTAAKPPPSLTDFGCSVEANIDDPTT